MALVYHPGQVMCQFMEDHAYNKDGGYTYHHCADVKITADPAKPIDKGWPGQ